MFSNRRQLRLWAARVLLVWLFGVGMGVANACWAASLAAQDGHHAGPVAAQQGDSEEATPECEYHAKSQQAGSGTPEPQPKSNCQTYCDGFSASMTPLKTVLDQPQPHAMAVATIALAAPAAGASPVHLLMSRRDGGQAPPVRIAFLRLAL